MIYSVWNQGAKAYDYYQSSAQQNGANTPSPSHLKKTSLGMTPEQAAWPLPSDARKLGRGAFPKGRIARKGGAVALSGVGGSEIQIGLLLVSAFLIWRYMR